MGIHLESVLSPFLIAVVIDAVKELGREGALSELLYADDLVLMSEKIKIFKSINAFESKGLKVNLWKTKIMVSGSITKDDMYKCKLEPCWVCSLRVEANLVLCLQCGKLIHGRCAGVKRATP